MVELPGITEANLTATELGTLQLTTYRMMQPLKIRDAHRLITKAGGSNQIRREP
jgi:hypothetical protein